MNKTLISLVLLSLVATQALAVVVKGKCRQVNTLADFEPSRYTGLWYEQNRYDFLFEKGLTCVTAEYSAINSSFIGVRNAGQNEITGKKSLIEGYANIPNPNEPNKLIVSLPIKVAGQTLFNNPAPYNVIATDYDNYSLVYSCTNLPLGYKYEIYWILGRAKSLDDTLIQSLKAELKNQGADLNELIKVDQSC